MYIYIFVLHQQIFSQDLEKWINDSKDGFVYFTFGSMVMIETFPREFLNILYASLGKITPVRVLMKIPNPEKLPPGLPENVYTSPWMSQIKILSESLFYRNYKIIQYVNTILP